MAALPFVKFPAFRFDIADGAMLAVVLMWAVNNVLIKITVDQLSPLAYVLGRFVIVTALVWAWIAWRGMPARIATHDVPLLIIVGVTGFGVYNALFTVGIERTSAFSAALLLSLSPVFTVIFARIAGIERLSPAQWVAIALAVLGVVLFVGDKLRGEGPGAGTIGDLLSMLAALSFAIYSLAARPLTSRYGATVTTAWAVAIGLAAVAPWGVPAARQQAWLDLSPVVWVSLLYAAVISMLAGYTLWSWTIARAGVTHTVPYLFLAPVVTGVISAVALGERFGLLKLAGAVMVLIGTTLVRLLGQGMVVTEEEPRGAAATIGGGRAPRPAATATPGAKPGL